MIHNYMLTHGYRRKLVLISAHTHAQAHSHKSLFHLRPCDPSRLGTESGTSHRNVNEPPKRERTTKTGTSHQNGNEPPQRESRHQNGNQDTKTGIKTPKRESRHQNGNHQLRGNNNGMVTLVISCKNFNPVKKQLGARV